MDVSEKWGNDVDTAVDLALAELKATRDEVEVTVLEQPSKGFFGIGAKLALVRVERKKPVQEEEPVSDKVVKESKPVKENRAEQKKPQKNQKPARRSEKKEEPMKSSIEGICRR